ncbi:hypothetical protein GCM10010123_28150 [Pilimelia anulata]|uniref:Uncharacterized protein n=1 Tax=Pilimelia anulata TaxID=53371 RepID=A0A8J3B5A4_9ACTN|nr:type I polyketide synthase [Pilimelia anulata]GGJ96551.1 hypothetical protein GCM10010123_28150 [Pilimelia anulata]
MTGSDEWERDDAVAVVAMDCRYPGGVRSPADLWRLVAQERDATSAFPDNRGWPAGAAGRGGFLPDADLFDAAFFGISPREAAGMDPQQRLVLEVAWGAVERAGLDRAALAGSNTGVYLGAMAQEYGPRLDDPDDGGAGYRLTGCSPSVASGRVAYVLGLRGPALTVDTACSGSLVAIHLAAGALRRGECDLALAGGVAVLAGPGMFLDFARQGGLAADGRCKAFADAADGTAWAEGVGLLLLERARDARAAGRRVLALIRGTATNQDGASNGLTAPSRAAQEDVIRRALRAAGLRPDDVDAVEAHGTGTALGDPIEARALAAVYGRGRAADRPLWLGSLKSNIGHAQAAAGVGGVIKMVRAMAAGTLPATLHAATPTRHVDWPRSGLALLTAARPWPAPPGRPRRAAVSSFGISGTNAHVILEAGPPTPAVGPASGAPVAWLLSAPTADGLRRQARALRPAVAGRRPEDVARTLRERTRFAHRAAVVAADPADLAAGLDRLAGGPAVPAVPGPYRAPVLLRAEAPAPRGAVLVFPGQGSQWRGMGVELSAGSAVFRDSLRDCADALAPHWAHDLAAVLRGEDLDRVDVVQPALFAVMVSLAALWRSAGVRPAAVVGHSQGEIAAAHVAGVLDLADAARVVAVRSAALRTVAGTGGMVAVPLDGDATLALLADVLGARADLVRPAALNGPTDTVVAGPPEPLAALLAGCAARGVDARRIDVDYASHTPAMAALRPALLDRLAGIAPRAGAVPLYSTLTGDRIDPATMDAGYWCANLAEPVRFAPAVRQLVAAGQRTFVEAGPHPVLARAIQGTLDALDVPGTVVGSLRRDTPGAGQFLAAVAAVHAAGTPVDLAAVQPPGERVGLPTYAFDRRRYWADRGAARDAAPAGRFVAGRLDLPGGTAFPARLDPGRDPWLAEHVIGGAAIVPATALLTLLAEVGAAVGAGSVAELTIGAPIPVAAGAADVRVMCEPADGGGRVAFTVHARGPGGDRWRRHAEGALAGTPAPAGPAEWAVAWPPAADEVDLADAYGGLARRGYGYGPGFTGLRRAWRRGTETFAEVSLPAAAGGGPTVHPALLDAALHAALLGGGATRVPFAWRGVVLAPGTAAALRVRLAADGDRLTVTCADERGRVLAAVAALDLRPLPTAATPDAAGAPADLGVPSATAAPGAATAPTAAAVNLRLDWEPVGARGGGVPDVAVGDGVPGVGGAVGGDAAAAAQTWVRLVPGAPIDLPDPPPAAVVAQLDTLVPPTPDRDPVAGTAAAVEAVAGLLREWLGAARPAGTRLILLTRHGAVLPGDGLATDLPAAAAIGLVRAAQTEHPGAFVLLDTDDPAAVPALLPAALAAGEPELAVRYGVLHRPRLRGRADALAAPAGGAWRLDVARRGAFDSLALLPHPAAEPGPREVRVAVRAAGLNFRDVVVGLGLVPTERTMGCEGAGVVTAVGPAVTRHAVGDRVYGVFGRALGPAAVADERLLRPPPAGWSFGAAAGVPIAFVTARQALYDVAGLRPGESVLVHAATGGVGRAALQLARARGAEVYATAGPAKHDLLRAWGVPDERIASSRSAAFADRFRAATGGRGMDVVLNCLTGAAVDAGLGLLAPGGRFVELGKTDVRDAAAVAAAHPGTRYAVYDILRADPDGVGAALDALGAQFAAGALDPVPTRAWDVRLARQPLDLLRRAVHRGKLVVTMPRSLDPDRPVLVTGGTGGLGAVLARHLVERHGVRRLVLASRRGERAAGAAALRSALRDRGADAVVEACDVGDRAALADLLARREPGAVVHAAGVLRDGVLTRLTPAALAAVLRPKAYGAWYLHELTADLDLSAFVTFSSAVGVLGGAGQANYAAASAFLDALAHYRRGRGLPALSLAWGLWELPTGMTGGLTPAEVRALGGIGLAPLPTAAGLALFDAALDAPEPLLVPVRPDPARVPPDSRAGRLWSATPPPAPGGPTNGTPTNGGPAHSTPADGGPTDGGADDGGADDEARAHAEPAGGGGRRGLLALVRAHAAEVLGHDDQSAIAPGDSFRDLGFDSLLSVDLRNRLNAETGLRLPAEAVLDNPTPAALVAFISGELAGRADAAPPL